MRVNSAMGNAIRVLSLAAMLCVAAAPQAQVGEGDYFTVKQAREAPKVSLGGTVIPYKEVALSAQIPGRVKHLAGIEGDTFKQGTLLVAIDDAELLAQRNSAIAAWYNADAQMRNAGVQYSREIWSPRAKQSPGGMGLPNLFDQMFTRPMESFSGTRSEGAERSADLYSQGIQISQAQNALMQAKAQIDAIDAKLRDARSIAPFDGVIMRKFIEVGDTMQPGQPLLVFADVEYLQIEVDVPARLAPGLAQGMMLQAELDVGKQLVPVRVAQIFPMADTQRHTVKVKFDLPQGVSAPGMYANVLVPDYTAPAREYPVIPTSSIRYNGSLPAVYVAGADGKPELRLIRVGERMGDGYVSVLSGLRENERILVNPGQGVAGDWTGGRR
jgi:multidrug efflux pump subunit AcrA (membrane-fusion protein)